MHSVAKNLLARQDKKPPFNDGKKISLVLCGGIMAGAVGAGAVIALEELGLRNAFDDIYAYSAGFCNASYFVSGQVRLGASIYYDDLSGSRFINFLRLWKILDIDYMIDVICTKKALDVGEIMRHMTKLYVPLTESSTGRVSYIEAHDVDKHDYALLMGASASVPYLHPGHVSINGNSYKDLGSGRIHLPDTLSFALSSSATDTVIIYNHPCQYYGLGEAKTQPTPGQVLEISPLREFQISRFETDKEKLKSAVLKMGAHVKNLFGTNGGISII